MRIPSILESFWFGSILMDGGLQPVNPIDSNKSKTYFFWQREIPSSDRAISRPRKNFGVYQEHKV